MSEYLTLFALGRITPCGNLMAMAIACGYHFQGFLGTLVALAAMIVPSFVITVILTSLYGALNGTPLMGLVSATLLPAAVGLIFATVFGLGRTSLIAPIPILVFILVIVLVRFTRLPTVANLGLAVVSGTAVYVASGNLIQGAP